MDHGRDLAAFYDQEAARRVTRAIDPARVEVREQFIAVLVAEGRRQVLEVGTGPGRDAAAFGEAGLSLRGLDLSFEHARLARGQGVAITQASLFHLPFRAESFEAAWTMSTLLHVPDARFHEAMREICRVLHPGALLAVGLWGGLDREGINHFDTIAPPRFFSLRSHDRARTMLEVHGGIERFQTWEHPDGPVDWEYQFAVVRI